MNFGWRATCATALSENDPDKRPERLAAAQKIIIRRLQELSGANEDVPEVLALREALDSLYAASPRQHFRAGELADEEQVHADRHKSMRIGAGICAAVIIAFAAAWMIQKTNEAKKLQRVRAAEARAEINTSSSIIAEPLDEPPVAEAAGEAHGTNPISEQPGPSAPGAGRVPDRNANTNRLSKPPVDGRANANFPGATPVTNPVQTPANDQSEAAAPAETIPDRTAQASPRTALSTEPPQEIQSAPVVDTRQGTPSAEPNNNEKQAEEKNQSTVAEAGAQQTSEIRASEVRQGSISVEASRYPSIHITPELKEAAARSGATLQIGEPVSRVEPVYPEDAERQGIEGTVKLRVLITRDGAVQSVQVVSGPSLLAGAAVNAVRQWRYQPTLLGDQPVEIAQDITVVFRIPGTSIAN